MSLLFVYGQIDITLSHAGDIKFSGMKSRREGTSDGRLLSGVGGPRGGRYGEGKQWSMREKGSQKRG